MSPDELVTSTRAASQLPRLLDALKKKNRRWFIQRNNKLEGVLISPAEYERWLELEELADHAALGQLIEQRERDWDGSGIDLDDLLKAHGLAGE